MEFLIFWISTIIASYGMKVVICLNMIKDIADTGYKINREGAANFGKQLYFDNTDTLLMMVPLLNMTYVAQVTMEYGHSRTDLITQLKSLGLITEMSKSEKMEYMRKPTAFNASKVWTKSVTASTLKLETVEGTSKISFAFGKDSDDIIIFEVTGPASSLTPDEQKTIVKGSIYKVSIKLLEEDVDLSTQSDVKIMLGTKDTRLKPIRKHMEELEKLKAEMILKSEEKYKDEEIISEQDQNDRPRLTK